MNKQITILLVSNTAHNILHFRKSLWKSMLKEGYKVIALAPADGREEELINAGLSFETLPRLNRFGSFPFADYLLYRQLRTIYRKHQPDLILHFTIKPNIYGSVAAFKEHIPSITTITGLGTTWLNGWFLKKVTTILYRLSLRRATVVVGQNAHDLESLQKAGVQAQQWQLIPGSGIDINNFHPSKNGIDKRHIHFLFLGRMLIDKGLEELFNAWRQINHLLPLAHLHLVGEMDKKHPRCIHKKIWEKGLALPRVKYHGYQENVQTYIKRCNVMVLPSYREGIPRSLLEAMAMAKPIISTDAPGCRELTLFRETGWRVPARSSAALAEAIVQAYRSNKKERKKLGNQGRKLIEEGYSEAIVAEQYLELITEILGDRK